MGSAIWLEAGFADHPKLVALPSDSARFGWVRAMLLAKVQRQPGQFASAAHFRLVLGRYGRWLAEYIHVGLLDEVNDGSLVVHDWRDYQRDKVDNTAAERQRRWREAHAVTNASVTALPGVTDNASPAGGRASAHVPVPVNVTVEDSAVENGTLRARRLPPLPVKAMDGTVTEVSVNGGPPADVFRLQKLAEELTQRPNVLANIYGGLGQKAVDEQLLPHRWARVEQAWRQVNARIRASQAGPPTLRQLVLGADDLLNPIPAGMDREAVQAEEQARFDRRVEATRKRQTATWGDE